MCYVRRIHNPRNHRNHTPVGQVERLACAVALAVDQHRVADASVRVVEREEVAVLRLSGEAERLDDEQPPILVMRMADGGDHRADDFADDHLSDWLITYVDSRFAWHRAEPSATGYRLWAT